MYVNTQSSYTPKTLSEYVFADKTAKQQVDSYVNGKQTKPIILYGSYGTGKSLLASLIPKAIDGKNVDALTYTAGELDKKQNIKDMYRLNDNYDRFFKPANQKFRYIIIEELNKTPTTYSEFRMALDDTEGRYLTIITTNELEKIDDAVKSRSTMINIKAAEPAVFLPRAKQIINSESYTIPDKKLLAALEAVSGGYKGNRAYYEVIDQILLAA